MKKTRSPWWLLLFFSLILGVVVGGAWFYIEQEQVMRREAEAKLQSILNLKVEQIVQWRQEILADAVDIADAPFLADVFLQSVADQQSEEILALQSYLAGFRNRHQYADILLVDRDGAIRLSLSDRVEPLPTLVNDAVMFVLRGNSLAMTDLYIDPEVSRPQIAVVAATWSVSGGRNPSGAIIVQADPQQFLYPLIESWPIPNESAETLLLRQDGEDVLFLNELRYQQDTALKLHLPITRITLPAVMVALGRQGIVEGIDYRGVSVMAAIKPVPDSPWFMVAKEDLSEVLADWQVRSRLIVLFFSGLLIAATTGFVALWQRDWKTHYHTMLRLQTEKMETEARYITTLMSIGDGVIATDVEGCVILMNPVAETLTGWLLQDACGRPLDEIFYVVNEYTRLPVENPVAEVLQRGLIVGLANHTLLLARDGQEYPIADSGAPIRDGQGHTVGVVLVFRDQSAERKVLRDLSESEERFRKIFSEGSLGMSLANENYHFLQVNAYFCQLLGFSEEELIGRTFKEITHPKDLQTSIENIRKLEEGAISVYRDQKRYLKKNKDIVWGSVTVSTLMDKDGKTLFLAMIEDITEYKRAEQELLLSEEKFRSIFENSTVGVALIGLDRRCLMANPAFGKIFGYSVDEFPMIGLEKIALPDDLELSRSIMQEVLDGEGKAVHLTKRYLHQDGHTIWAEVSAVLMYDADGSPSYFIIHVNDITERRQHEEEIHQLNNVLEERVRERTQRLEAANQELEAFTYSVSHDLRAPLRAINGFTKIMLEEHGQSFDTEGLRLGNLIRENALNMAELIDNLLALSRLGRMELHKDLLDMKTMVATIYEELTTPESRQDITFHLGELPPAEVDETSLRQVWTNFLSNAIKFSAKQEHAVIDVYGEVLQDEVVYSVRDNGTGFDMAYADKLFGVFQRLHTVDEYDGTGVGLAIVKRLIARHGGRVWADGKLGQGAVFSFSLPLNDA